MQSPRTRRVQRVHFAQPLIARLGATQVVVVDLSLFGARIEHNAPVTTGNHMRLVFRWDGEEVTIGCRVVRSRLERFSTGPDGLTIYHSGLEFENLSQETKELLKNVIAGFIARALEEQKLNARGMVPDHDVTHMPIFRYEGELTANQREVKDSLGSPLGAALRIARETGYICYQLERNQWRKKHTHDPEQPSEGFTISALEDRAQVALLCNAYQKADRQVRRMIQLMAQMSIMDGEGIDPGRFEP